MRLAKQNNWAHLRKVTYVDCSRKGWKNCIKKKKKALLEGF